MAAKIGMTPPTIGKVLKIFGGRIGMWSIESVPAA